MPIKYEYNYSKLIEGSLWKHMVAISFTPVYAGFRRPEVPEVAHRRVVRQHYLSLQQEFIKFMAEHYGPQEGRWSIRWSDYGVDIRFQNDEDAGSFILFFTENSQPRDMVETPVSV